MSDFDRNLATARSGYRTDVAIDAGRRAYMMRVYNYMAAGVTLTGLAAWITFSAAVVQTGAGLQLTSFGQAVLQGPLMWILVLAPLGLVFAGLTAWDTQRIKEMYSPMDDGTVGGRKAVMGALSLYLDFINLFLMLLRLMGDRR